MIGTDPSGPPASSRAARSHELMNWDLRHSWNVIAAEWVHAVCDPITLSTACRRARHTPRLWHISLAPKFSWLDANRLLFFFFRRCADWYRRVRTARVLAGSKVARIKEL